MKKWKIDGPDGMSAAEVHRSKKEPDYRDDCVFSEPRTARIRGESIYGEEDDLFEDPESVRIWGESDYEEENLFEKSKPVLIWGESDYEEENLFGESESCRIRGSIEGEDEEELFDEIGYNEIYYPKSEKKKVAHVAESRDLDEDIYRIEADAPQVSNDCFPYKEWYSLTYQKNTRKQQKEDDGSVQTEHGQSPSANAQRKTSLSEAGEVDMRVIEKYALEQIIIRRIHNRLYYYDGRIYRPLSKEKFLLLLRSCLPPQIEKSIAGMYRMEESYKYLFVNPDIEMEISTETVCFVRRCIVFDDCIYDVENDKTLDFSPEYPFFFYINAQFIPDIKECKTPNFDHFLEVVTQGNKEIQNLILQMLGYIVMHSMDAKCFFILGTAPNSGKSLLGEFISRLFDEEFVGTLPLTELGRRFALGSLWKQAVNISMDLPTRSLTEQEVSQIKMITGEARVSTEEKYEPVGTTYLHCKSIFATNGKISLKVYDRAFWERVVFIPFQYSVPKEKQDRRLLDKLLAERDGIMSKAACAAQTLIANNFVFRLPKEAENMLAEWSMNSVDSITRFLDSECEINCEASIFSDELYGRYKEYCSDNQLQPETQTLLSKRVNELPGVCKRKRRREKMENPIWMFEGIGLAESM